MLKIDMKILVLESVWELRSHSLHWLSSKPIIHFPIWIFKKSSLHSEKFHRTSFSRHSPKFTKFHTSSHKPWTTPLTLHHSHGNPHSLNPPSSTLSHSPAFHPIQALLHTHPPSNTSPTHTFTNVHLHSKMNPFSPVLLPAWEFHPPFLHRLSSYWTLPNALSIIRPFLFHPEKSLQTSSIFALQIAPFFTPLFATSPSTVSNSSTHESFSEFCSERVLDAIHIPSLSWDPRGRGSWRSSRSSRFTLFLTPTLTLAQPMKFVGSQLNLNGIPQESALRPSGWKLQRVSKLRIWLSRVYVCVWWNSLVNQAMTEQIQAKPRFFHVAS